jgi:hypothetical protein
MDWPAVAAAMLTSYPFWGAVVLIAALTMFRKAIVALVEKIRAFRWGERAVELEQQQRQQQEARPALDARNAADETLRAMDNDYLRAQEERLRLDMEERGILADPTEAVRVLLRLATATWIHAEFEGIEGTLFGGQLRILQALNAGPQSHDALRPFYDAGTAGVSNAPTFDRYLLFLEGQHLMQRAPANGPFSITARGRAFLLWRVQQGKPADLVF